MITTYLVVSALFWTARAYLRFMPLVDNDYPRRETRKREHDTFVFCVSVVMGIWTCVMFILV